MHPQALALTLTLTWRWQWNGTKVQVLTQNIAIHEQLQTVVTKAEECPWKCIVNFHCARLSLPVHLCLMCSQLVKSLQPQQWNYLPTPLQPIAEKNNVQLTNPVDHHVSLVPSRGGGAWGRASLASQTHFRLGDYNRTRLGLCGRNQWCAAWVSDSENELTASLS